MLPWIVNMASFVRDSVINICSINGSHYGWRKGLSTLFWKETVKGLKELSHTFLIFSLPHIFSDIKILHAVPGGLKI
jgi:hypothetical protein